MANGINFFAGIVAQREKTAASAPLKWGGLQALSVLFTFAQLCATRCKQQAPHLAALCEKLLAVGADAYLASAEKYFATATKKSEKRTMAALSAHAAKYALEYNATFIFAKARESFKRNLLRAVADSGKLSADCKALAVDINQCLQGIVSPIDGKRLIETVTVSDKPQAPQAPAAQQTASAGK